MSQLLRKFKYHYREAGLGGLMRKMVGVVRQKLWSADQWLIYEKSLGGAVCSLRAAVARRELGFNELVEFGYFKALDFPDAIRHRIESGIVCHGFFEGDRLVTVGWSTANYLELDADVSILSPGSVGLYDFFTFREFRSKGYYTNALVHLLAVMRDAGHARVRIAVDPNNVPSIKGIERAGFRRTIRVTRRRRLGMQDIVEERIAKY